MRQAHNETSRSTRTPVRITAVGVPAARPRPLQDFYRATLARGMREELARVTLTRKLAALTLRLWKKGDAYEPTELTKHPKQKAAGAAIFRPKSLAAKSE